jgi:hypothetical protein
MIKNKGDDIGKVEDMGVIGQGKEKTWKENSEEQCKTQKWTSTKEAL